MPNSDEVKKHCVLKRKITYFGVQNITGNL